MGATAVRANAPAAAPAIASVIVRLVALWLLLMVVSFTGQLSGQTRGVADEFEEGRPSLIIGALVPVGIARYRSSGPRSARVLSLACSTTLNYLLAE